MARNDPSDNTILIAYLVPHSHPSPTITSLRDFLKERLPDYMIPSAFVTLDKLPLLSTGKVDRRALPEPANKRPDLDTPFVAPRTPVEKQLSRVWVETLGIDAVGIDDNFFELGGHSLLATQVVSRVREVFGVELPLRALFETPELEALARTIERLPRAAGEPGRAPLRALPREPRRAPLPSPPRSEP